MSYSNPVRQSLFEFGDCLNSGKSKAKAAAESLKRIFPHVITEGYSFMIPMPGHVSFAAGNFVQFSPEFLPFINESSPLSSRWNEEGCRSLRKANRSTWLCLPSHGLSRESLASYGNRPSQEKGMIYYSHSPMKHLLIILFLQLVINAALGFDTYLVQRHGIPCIPTSGDKTSHDSDSHQKLGCYFCNDVVAPGDVSSYSPL